MKRTPEKTPETTTASEPRPAVPDPYEEWDEDDGDTARVRPHRAKDEVVPRRKKTRRRRPEPGQL